ncbi:ribosome-associated protein [Desulfocicer vacuolatum DSM 3385]|uniref:Ribosomal silencing factor RsfS n=1 Tax=Desulfocicer vacuolatum DSM 3385 TaxID=1121400 RepID=A0A1W2DA69_9BACT|nr:ribosome silencing factor [Desulfocicer vacuolatum]SMC94380.1 ribosome-associated protein [Desulfocicer vacuolatum DSM 3385]
MIQDPNAAGNPEQFLAAAFQRKPEKVVALDVRGLTAYADTIIIITATSARQVTAIAEHIYIEMKKQKIMPLGTEGIKEGTWALLDFSDVLIHVFDRESNAFYDLEGLWADAPRLDISSFESLDI